MNIKFAQNFKINFFLRISNSLIFNYHINLIKNSIFLNAFNFIRRKSNRFLLNDALKLKFIRGFFTVSIIIKLT